MSNEVCLTPVEGFMRLSECRRTPFGAGTEWTSRRSSWWNKATTSLGRFWFGSPFYLNVLISWINLQKWQNMKHMNLCTFTLTPLCRISDEQRVVDNDLIGWESIALYSIKAGLRSNQMRQHKGKSISNDYRLPYAPIGEHTCLTIW